MTAQEREYIEIFRERVKRNYDDMDAHNQLFMRPVVSATNFDLRICREHAIQLVKEGREDVMCEEYGDDEDWVGLTIEDLHDLEGDGNLDLYEEYQTFELWIPYVDRQTFMQILKDEYEYHRAYELADDGSNLLEFRATLNPKACKLFDELAEIGETDYPELKRYQELLAEHGVTFDYGLDGVPMEFKITRPSEDK